MNSRPERVVAPQKTRAHQGVTGSVGAYGQTFAFNVEILDTRSKQL
jgi:hypothetical protein